MFTELKLRAEVLIDYLVAEAGKDPLEDRFKVGYIAAINDFVGVKVEDVTN